ncbi:MAG: alpha/beta hydrolase [Desulfuromonas sp.]|nr:MAG: alpha/beta hydrolase [Desulfuromonas sp.]
MSSFTLLDHPLITNRYFFPRREAPKQPYYIDIEGGQLACAYFEAAPEAVTVIHFHGNGEVAADWADGFEQFILDCGCNLLLAEFRGYGGSDGEPELGKMLADVPIIIESLGKPTDHMVVFGRSVGSIFALEAVKHFPNLRGLILESGIADVRERLLMRVSPAELGISPGDFDHILDVTLNHQTKLAGYSGPLLVLHARHDSLVDVSHAERLYSWGQGPKKQMIFPKGDHNDILFANLDEYLAAVRNFLQEVQTPS